MLRRKGESAIAIENPLKRHSHSTHERLCKPPRMPQIHNAHRLLVIPYGVAEPPENILELKSSRTGAEKIVQL